MREGRTARKVLEGMCREERMWPPMWSEVRRSIIEGEGLGVGGVDWSVDWDGELG